MSDDGEWMLIGRLGAAHGVRGELAVEPFTDDPSRFRDLNKIYIGDKRRELTIAQARIQSRIFLRFEGVETREEARRLRNQEIWIPRDEALPLPEGQYYADEIIGLRVETEDGNGFGSIIDLFETPANDVYVVDHDGREVLIPAIRDVVIAIEPENGRVVIKLIEGLVE